MTVTNSTFSDNSAVGAGGGIFNYDGTVTVGDSSFSGYTPDAIGGTGYTDEGAKIQLRRNAQLIGQPQRQRRICSEVL